MSDITMSSPRSVYTVGSAPKSGTRSRFARTRFAFGDTSFTAGELIRHAKSYVGVPGGHAEFTGWCAAYVPQEDLERICNEAGLRP